MPIQYLFVMKMFIRPPGSPLEWIWRWRWSRKITVRGSLCRLRAIWCCICGGPAANRSSAPRNFARVFAKEMKTTPAKFVERLRIEAARRRLEESHSSMELIAGECGFGNVNSMRNVFQRTLKIAPGQYRRHFRHVKNSA